jgi:lipopolysaccharide assembly protein B
LRAYLRNAYAQSPSPMNLQAILVLLLPFASFSGYLIGRRGSERSSGARVDQLSQQYFQGLNHDDTDRFDTQLALGNLFRRRGELDRAMKLHQDLSVKTMLSTEQRALALLELGDDFVRAGLLDRAETLFDELLQIDAQSRPALKHLIGIYEQERDWQKAIHAATKYQQLSGQNMGKLMAHYDCELAALAERNQQPAQMQKHLADALAHDPDSVRAQLARAADAIASKDCATARQALERVMDGDASYVVDLLPLIGQIAQHNERVGRDLFERAVELDRGASALLAFTQWLAQRDEYAAEALLRARLDTKPSAPVLARWLKLTKATIAPETRSVLQAGLNQVTEQVLSHRCSVCGFGARQLHWQCPSCKGWGTIKPMALL